MNASELGASKKSSVDAERLDSETISALYEAHGRDLLNFLLGVLRNAEQAEDVLQATFAKAIETGHTSSEKSRKGWLFRVAFNEAMQIKRRGRTHDRSTKQLGWMRDEHDDTRGEDHAVRLEEIARVREALEHLPEPQREVVRKRIYEEKTFAVIAEELECPLGTVLTRMRLALAKLANRLDDADQSEPDEPN